MLAASFRLATCGALLTGCSGGGVAMLLTAGCLGADDAAGAVGNAIPVTGTAHHPPEETAGAGGPATAAGAVTGALYSPRARKNDPCPPGRPPPGPEKR